MDHQIVTALVIAGVTGGVSTAATVVALRVATKIHIDYLREGVKRIEVSAGHAHKRISDLEHNLNNSNRGK